MKFAFAEIFHPRDGPSRSVVASLMLLISGALAGVPAGSQSLPESFPATVTIRINAPAARLDVERNGALIRSFPVSPGTKRYRTPVGQFEMTEVTWNPWWYPPKSWWARKEKITPPGAANPMGKVKMKIGDLLYLHATPSVSQIGHPASHGCIRMLPEDAVALARLVQRETRTLITDEAVDSLVEGWDATRTVRLAEPVAVSITYDLIEVRGDSLLIHPDIYSRAARPNASAILRLLKQSGFEIEHVDRGKIDQLLRRERSATVGERILSLMKP